MSKYAIELLNKAGCKRFDEGSYTNLKVCRQNAKEYTKLGWNVNIWEELSDDCSLAEMEYVESYRAYTTKRITDQL